ncbi:ABC transporter ATP-binding protein [Paenibacillus crassostreae]|uniref:Spermidine/putrescine ABC transporter ATP-binding protein n=1 Tax=Paenibacillus crassostreae TaxID=1763538 RepID=A0A167DRI9_9BACL|nr:ABC transporter ATP-binding protein [Paenibacillus crassostreae]AOZ91144.1 spermidine/putrescine ABC transporter ATP-binding protein [Paenibacillus crassostreae]OAB74697.1 spermidine/putrescine ABC transporter ATP-binding protein [Paenibacillus crassostreae]
MVPVVELNDVAHIYITDREASLAVDQLQMTVSQGEFVSLVGPSGCGKTTILSIIAGLIIPSQGEVLVNGRNIAGPTSEVGYMLQQDYLFPWRTILNNALLGLELTGALTRENIAKTSALLAEMGLQGKENFYPLQLSGGMRQRVALVRTLATDPDLLLLDEPFSALDYQTKLQLEDLISRTLRERKKTAVLVTHDLSEAIAMSDRIILLGSNPGRIRKWFDVPQNIREVLPFHARAQEGFQDLFHEIWNAMEKESIS